MRSSSLQTPSKSAKTTKAKKADRPRRRKKRVETFSSYIYKVLKQVHPDTGISRRAMVRGGGEGVGPFVR